MRGRALILLLLLLGSGFSGCLGIGATGKDAPTGIVGNEAARSPVWEKLRDQLANVPCTVNAVSSTQTSANLKELSSFRPPVSILGPALMGELDVQHNRSAIAHYNQVGFSWINNTDPAQPKYQGSPLVLLGSGNILTTQYYPTPASYDVKISHDGTLVFLGLSDRILTFDATPQFPRYNFQTFQLMHPPNYRGQAHMLATQVINHVEYVFAVPSTSGAGVLVAKVQGSGYQGRLELVTVYQSPTPTAGTQLLAPHDMFFRVEPVNGANSTFLYLANGFGGIVVLNVDDPLKPVTVASIPAGAGELPASAAPSYYHSIQAATIGGKRIVVTSAELGYNTLKVWDFTDFRAPKLLGQWLFDAGQPGKPQHNIQIVNGTLFLAHYTEGLFGFDLSVFLNNTRAGLKPALHFQPTGGQTWDIVVEDGILYLSDISQGLQALGYGCFAPGDARLTSGG